jgi:hypothetical protein
MKTLLIKNKFMWRDSASAALGEQLDVSDSSYNMLIFTEDNTEKDILDIISDVPKDAYQLFDLEKAPEDEYEYMADSGTCYRQPHGSLESHA